MVDFEGALRSMAEQEKAAICVPAAFKDFGLNVPQSAFINAAMSNSMNPESLAVELGLSLVETPKLTLVELYKTYQELRNKGLFPFIRIGAPTQLGVLGQHLNSIISIAQVEKQKAFRLGGIPPFGKDGGNIFPVSVLEKVVPINGGILVFKKE